MDSQKETARASELDTRLLDVENPDGTAAGGVALNPNKGDSKGDAPPTALERHCGWRWGTCNMRGHVCAIVSITLLIVITTLVLVGVFVGGAALAQSSMDNAGVTITSLSMSEFSDLKRVTGNRSLIGGGSFKLHLVGSLDNRSPLAATMHEAEVTMTYPVCCTTASGVGREVCVPKYVPKSPHVTCSQRAVGSMTLSQQDLPASGQLALDITPTVSVNTAQKPAFDTFSRDLLANKTIALGMQASVDVTASGLTFKGLKLDKSVTLKGFGSFLEPAPVVTRTSVVKTAYRPPSAHDGAGEDSITMELDIELENRATVEIHGMAPLKFQVFSGVPGDFFSNPLGTVVTTGNATSVAFGRNKYIAVATLTRRCSPWQSCKDLRFIEIMSNYSSGLPSILKLKGDDSLTQSQPALLQYGLSHLTTQGVLPGLKTPMLANAVNANFHVPGPADSDAACGRLGGRTQNLTFGIDYVVRNPLAVPVKVKSLDLYAVWQGSAQAAPAIAPPGVCDAPALPTRVLSGFNSAAELSIPAHGQVIYHQSMCDLSGPAVPQEELKVYNNFLLCMTFMAAEAQQKGGAPFTVKFGVEGKMHGCLGKDFCTDIDYRQKTLSAINIPKA